MYISYLSAQKRWRSNGKKCAPCVLQYIPRNMHSFCFAVLCCGYTLTDFPISIRLTSLALWQSNDCPSASKATLMNMDKYFMWIHYERLHNHSKAKHNNTVCIFLGIYCMLLADTIATWCCFLLKLSLMRSFCFSRNVLAILISGREICRLPTNLICDRPGATLLCINFCRTLGLNRSKYNKIYPGCRLSRCVMARRQHDAGPALARGGLLPGLRVSQL